MQCRMRRTVRVDPRIADCGSIRKKPPARSLSSLERRTTRCLAPRSPAEPWHDRRVRLHRRELLGALGATSATTLLWALGCTRPAPPARTPRVDGELRAWLYDAVARLAAVYPSVHALAVSRHRTVAARDVLGGGQAREHRTGVIFTIRDATGARREYATSELTAAGIATATRALGAADRRASIHPAELGDVGEALAQPAATRSSQSGPAAHAAQRNAAEQRPGAADPDATEQAAIDARLDALLQRAGERASQIVYAAGLVDLDDAVVWSITPERAQYQRLARVRETVTRAAWTGTQPVLVERQRAWTGALAPRGIDDIALDEANRGALELMTPGDFPDGTHAVVLDASVAAALFDALADQLLAATIPDPAAIAAALVTLIDAPATPGAYGCCAFDDAGQAATPITLLDAGHTTASVDLARRARRPGHLGALVVAPTHLALAPGTASTTELYTDGFAIETALSANVDLATDRLRIACQRARELKAGRITGRVYADVEITGSLRATLAAIDAIGNERRSYAAAHLDLPLWRSISAPMLRTRAHVRARRS